MKALVKKRAEPGLSLEDVPEPSVIPQHVLIKVRKTAICGTDRHIYDWDEWAATRVPVPLVIGHECMGEIIEVGADVIHLAVGQRVAIEGHLLCGHCYNCQTGSHLCQNVQGMGYDVSGMFSEYLLAPASNVIQLPDALTDEMGAILDPFGNAVLATSMASLSCEDVLIMGAGPVGLFTVAIAKYMGAQNVTVCDMNPYRLALAEQVGADTLYNPEYDDIETIKAELQLKGGYSVGFEMSGNQNGLNELIKHLRNEANVLLLGLYSHAPSANLNDVIFKGLRCQGVYGRELFKTWLQAMKLLESGLDISPIITHQYDYTDYEAAFSTLTNGQSGKVILNWT